MVEITTLPPDAKRSGYGFNVWLTQRLGTIVEKGVVEAIVKAIANDPALQKYLGIEIRRAISDFGPELTKKAVREFLKGEV